MKKVFVVLVLSLGMLPAWVWAECMIPEEVSIAANRFITKNAAHELLNKSIGDCSIEISGVSLLSTEEAASILADFTFQALTETDYSYNDDVKQEMNVKEIGKTVAILYIREKLIHSTHYLAKKTGLSLPKWFKNSPSLMGALDIGEHVAANIVLKSLVDKKFSEQKDFPPFS